VFDVGMLKAVGVKQGAVIAFYQLWFAAAFLLSCIPLIGPIIGDLLLALFFYTSYPPPPPPSFHRLILPKRCPSIYPVSYLPRNRPIGRLFGPCPYEKKTGAHAAAKEGSKVHSRPPLHPHA
jgi:hypothetical protein